MWGMVLASSSALICPKVLAVMNRDAAPSVKLDSQYGCFFSASREFANINVHRSYARSLDRLFYIAGGS